MPVFFLTHDAPAVRQHRLDFADRVIAGVGFRNERGVFAKR
jgi:hypothetical protein